MSEGHMRGRTAAILALEAEGWSRADIARELGCSQPNVCRVIRRHREQILVRSIERDLAMWVYREADKIKVTPSAFIISILRDARAEDINDG